MTSSARSTLMSRVRNTNTWPEKRVRSILHRNGLRFRLHRSDLPGTPDIVFPSKRKVIFVHGCFWHRHQGCRRASVPATNPERWRVKFAQNVARDAKAHAALEASGWDVLIVWECDVKKEVELENRLRSWLRLADK